MTVYHEFDDFQKIWNRAATLEEAAANLGCSKRLASNRATAHRKKGRALKEFPKPPKSNGEKLREPDPEFDRLLARVNEGRRELTRREELLFQKHIAHRAAVLRGEA